MIQPKNQVDKNVAYIFINGGYKYVSFYPSSKTYFISGDKNVYTVIPSRNKKKINKI